MSRKVTTDREVASTYSYVIVYELDRRTIASSPICVFRGAQEMRRP